MAETYDQPPVKTYSFINAMFKAITSPSQTTYRTLAQDPNADAAKGFLWVAVASLISSLISILLTQIFPQNPFLQFMEQYSGGTWDMPARTDAFGLFFSLLCGIPIGVVLAVVGFAILTGLLHLVARLLGGTGDYGRLVYMMALVSVPLSLVSSILAPIPYLGCVTFLFFIYALVLQVLAIDAVHLFGIAKAAVTLIIPWIVLCLLVACIVAGLASFLAIAFQETFQNLPQQFPVP